MRNGLVASGLPEGLPNSADIADACLLEPTFSPLVAYAIKLNETGYAADAATVVSFDGGRGLFQLTFDFPDNWRDPYANARFAVQRFLYPAELYWQNVAQGDDLVRCIAAEFNAGRGNAMAGHARGDVGMFTTAAYDLRALDKYRLLQQGIKP